MEASWDTLRCKTQYYDYIRSAIELEDVIDHTQGHQVWYRSSVRWSFYQRPRRCWTPALNTLESWWYRYFEQLSLKMLALFCALLSVLVVWTEVTQFTFNPKGLALDLSVFSLLLGTARTPFAVELLVWVTVSYITVCVFSSIFAVKVRNDVWSQSTRNTNTRLHSPSLQRKKKHKIGKKKKNEQKPAFLENTKTKEQQTQQVTIKNQTTFLSNMFLLSSRSV